MNSSTNIHMTTRHFHKDILCVHLFCDSYHKKTRKKGNNYNTWGKNINMHAKYLFVQSNGCETAYHTYIHKYIHTYIHIQTYVYTYIYACVCMGAKQRTIHTYNIHTYTYIHVCISMGVKHQLKIAHKPYIHIHTYVYTYIHTYTCNVCETVYLGCAHQLKIAYIHTYIHTYMYMHGCETVYLGCAHQLKIAHKARGLFNFGKRRLSA
jgi:hypothetical protein